MGVHRAARISAAAHGGQVLLSGATRALVEDELPDDVRIVDLGEFRLKDIDRHSVTVRRRDGGPAPPPLPGYASGTRRSPSTAAASPDTSDS
jgi:class 3 adenylate cyclase